MEREKRERGEREEREERERDPSNTASGVREREIGSQERHRLSCSNNAPKVRKGRRRRCVCANIWRPPLTRKLF